MLPWLMERGEVSVSEVAERFDLTEDEVVGDLELAAMCGLPPFVDELIDVFIDEGMIFVGVPRLFTRPLRLNSVEAFELLAAGRAAMELPGADPDGALARGLAKLAAALGEDDTRRSSGRARRAPSSPIDLATAATEHRAAPDRVHRRRPRRDDRARDRPASGVRRPRRVVRQRRRRALGGGAHVPRSTASTSVEPTGAIVEPSSEPRPGARRLVRRRVRADVPSCGCRRRRSGWSSASRSTPSRAPDADGWSTVTLPVASEQWLVRTLLRLGPEADARSSRPSGATSVSQAARPRAGALPALVERIEVDAGRDWLSASRWWSTRGGGTRVVERVVRRASW